MAYWGIGVSVWLHDSGVVVLQKDENTIVTALSSYSIPT